jgi:hypothetical protein
MHASSSSSRSYNDVFFQRRPENSGAAANSASEEIHVDDLGTTAPIAAAEVVSVSVLPEAAASASMDATAVDAIAVGPAPSVVTVAAPVTQVEAAPEQVKPSPVNNIAQPQASVETGSHEETKTGFFSRIFGRLHK